MDKRRRRIIEVIGVSGFTTIAGCSSSDAENPATTTQGPNDTTPSGESATASPAYQEFLVAPNAFPNHEHYYFNSIDYERIRSVRDELDEDVFSQFQSFVEMEDFAEFDLSLEDISETVKIRPMVEPGIGGWNIILGEFSKDAIEEAFTSSLDLTDSSETDDSGEHNASVSSEEKGAYALYFGGELNESAVALADGVLLLGTSSQMDSASNVRSIIDAKEGEAARYIDQNENMAVISNKLGDETFLGGQTYDKVTKTEPKSGLFEGQVGYGYADTVRGEVMETKEVFVFDERASVNMDTMEEYTEIELFDDFTSSSVSQDGRVVLVTGEVVTADIYG